LIELGRSLVDWNSEVPSSRVPGGVSQMLGALPSPHHHLGSKGMRMLHHKQIRELKPLTSSIVLDVLQPPPGKWVVYCK